MKVKWQSDAPNMELVIPKGQYLPYELPVATKEVLGGVKVDGDTINITSDGVISAQKVDLSGVATKVELEEVENKIPDTSGLATKNELATVESKIPDTSGLATKTELTAVENKIPDVSGFATKDEIPNVSGLATKVELNEVAATIPSSDDLATKAELNAVQSSIPDTTGLATKVELSNVEAKIPDISGLATKAELPTEYVKSVNSANNALTFTTNSNNTVEYKPIFYVNATMDGLSGGSLVQRGGEITADKTYDEINNALIAGKMVQLKIVNTKYNANDYWVMTSALVCNSDTTKSIIFFGHGKLGSDNAYVSKSTYWTYKAVVYDNNTWVFEGDNICRTAITQSEQFVREQAFATQASLSNVEAKIPDISGLATKVELSNVAADIPGTYLEVANLGNGSLTIINNKGESVTFTPSTGGAVDSVNGQTGTVVLDIPTKVSELENDSGYLTSHQDISNLATKVELSTVEAKIPDTSNFATKNEVSSVEAKIPTTYLKSATVNNNKLTITNADDTSIEFSGGSSGGGGSSGSLIPVYSFTSGQELTAEEKGQLDIIKNNPKSVIVYIDGLKANNIYSASNTIAFTVGGDANIDVTEYSNGDKASYKPQHGGLYLYSFYNTYIYDTVLGKNVKVDNTKIKKVRSGDFIVTNINSSGSYSSLNEDFIVDWIHNPNQYNVTVDNKPVIYVNNNSNSTSVEVYTLTPGYGGITLGGTSLYFSDNKKLAFNSNSTQYYAMAGTTLLDSSNWQNYISLGGQSSWTYTPGTSDSSLYNATELIIYWHKDYQYYYCNYYKFDQGSGSTLGGNYQWQTFNAYDHSDGSGTSSWHYDGSNINTSNMAILGLYYKT